MITPIEGRREPSHVNGEMTGNLLQNQKEIDNPASHWWLNHSGIFVLGKWDKVFASCNYCWS